MTTKTLLCCCVLLGMTVFASVLNAQGISHSDVFFTYGETKIEITEQDGRLVIPQVMPAGGFFAQANSNPGFFSESDLGGGTAPNDVVGYNVLGDLVFWSDGEFAQPKADTSIRILNNPGFVEDVVIGTETGEQLAQFDPLSNSIGQSAASGDFHAHVDFRLEPNSSDPEEMPLFGAYGLKLSLASDNPSVTESDPFFVVFDFGMEEEQFTDALDDFEALLTVDESLLGDFDLDGILSASDIDLLSAEVLAGTNDPLFDVTADAIVDELDRMTWVEGLAGSLLGDTDLDGNVQFSDFLALSNAFGGQGGWAEGDFDGNGVVQFPDFLALSTNFGTSVAASRAVPEPRTSIHLAILLVMIASLLSRNSGKGHGRG